ncbi:MAG: Gfo/Idh/MocA family oxidoreductase [Saprospiraceae bacterium]|nr:Gfo/Idh/MocA family oxidoreductase [Saprospiraceae bacterium]
MSNNRLKIGLVGLGHLGKIHLKCLQQLEDADITGIYDLNAEVTTKVAELFGVKPYFDLDELIRDSDAIDVVAPTSAHYKVAEKVITQGKHVFIEKPVVSDLEDGYRLQNLIEDYQVIAQVGHVERFNPAFLAMKGKEIHPLFIEAHRLAEFNPRGTDVSVVLDLMIHDLDLILHMVPSEIIKISASGVCVVSNSADISNVRLEFENGCVANITASRLALKRMRKIRLFQRDTYISMDFLEKQLQIVQLEDESQIQVDGKFYFDLDLPDAKKKVSMEMPEVPQINAILEELRAFRDSVLLGTPVAVPVTEAIKVLELAQAIEREILARNERISIH